MLNMKLPITIPNFAIFRLIQKNQLLVWLIAVVLFSLPSFTTLLQPGYFGMHDDLQIMRIHQMDKCFKDGQIPCRWVPDMGYGYGYPLFNFYPVMPYYLGESIHLLGFNLIWSVKIDFILSFIVAAISMFFLARAFWGNLGGFLSSMFYLYVPYHAVDVYVRGAMAENWSIAWAPAVFLMIYHLIKKQNSKNLLLLSVFSALFLMSHNPLALIFTPVIAIWTAIIIFQTKNFRSILSLILSAFWALSLAAFFTLPVIFEGKLVHLETLFIGYFNYLAHFVSLNQMFVSDFWGFGGSIWGDGDGMSFQIGWLHSLTMIFMFLIAILNWEKDKNKSMILIFMIGVFLFSAFLMHPRSNFIWERVTILQNIQFPWRILSIVIFASSFSAGALTILPVRESIKIALVGVLLLSMAFLYQRYFKIEKSIPLTDQEKLSGALWDLQRTAGIFDYLPKSAKFPPGGPAPGVEVISGKADIKNFKQGTNWLEFEVTIDSDSTLRLPIIYLPNWKVFVNNENSQAKVKSFFANRNKEVEFKIDNDLGQPTFDLKAGKYEIFAKLYDTPVRKISNVISLISFSILMFVVYQIWRRNERT